MLLCLAAVASGFGLGAPLARVVTCVRASSPACALPSIDDARKLSTTELAAEIDAASKVVFRARAARTPCPRVSADPLRRCCAADRAGTSRRSSSSCARR